MEKYRGTIDRTLKILFFALVVWPLVLVVIGLNVRGRKRLPRKGPAIIAANHNSHLDTLVLMSLFPLALVPSVRPVAAADYFLSSKALAFIASRLMGIIPFDRDAARALREGNDTDPFEESVAALKRGEILILFPEGTRGAPEELKTFKSGITRLARRVPEAPVVPILLHGLGKALPKGSRVPVPFFCDVLVGEPLPPATSRAELMESLKDAFASLAAEGQFPEWK